MSNTDINPEPTPEELEAASQPAVAPLRMDVGRGEQPWPVTDDASYERVPYGKRYVSPKGDIRQKNYVVTDDASYAAVPDGAAYIDPDGNERVKPTYEGIGYTAQTLYDMAINPKEKRKVLEKYYPGKVVEEGNELVVDDDGVLRKPGRGATRDLAFVSSMAAPTVGGVVGALGAGPWGAVGGTVAGQMLVNDLIMDWSGLSERTHGERAGNVGLGAASSVAGYGVGKGLGAIAPMLAGAGKTTKDVAPVAIAHFLGAGPEVKVAREIAERTEKPAQGSGIIAATRRKLGHTDTDTPTGVSAWAHEAPYVQMLDEVYYPKFFTNQPHVRAAEENYRRGASQILGREIQSVDDLLRPKEAVPTQEVGELLQKRAARDQSVLANELEEKLTQREMELRAGVPETSRAATDAQRILREQRDEAQRIIDQRLAAVEPEVNQALAAAGAGTNPGQFWARTGERLQQVRREVGNEAGRQYNAAYRLAGGNRINAEPLSQAAIDFLEQAPEQLRQQVNHPVIRRLRQIAGVPDGEGGWVTQRTPLSLEELQDVRSWLRSMADYDDLPSSFKNGAVKHFASQADQLIQAAGRTPQLRPAVEALNAADDWYRNNIRIFNATELKAVMRGLQSGQPADRELLYKTLIKSDATDRIAEFERILGPQMWNGVRGIQRQRWIDKAREGDFADRINAQKYAEEVLAAHQDGTLSAVQGAQNAQRMLREAQQIAVMNGKMDIQIAPGDTTFDIFQRARTAQAQLDQLAKTDPIALAEMEIKKALDAQRQANKTAMSRPDDELKFVYDPTYGTQKAVDRILDSDDLILAAVKRWGENSPEMEGLRRIYVDRLFRGSTDLQTKLQAIKPEVQQLMLPGVKLDLARKLADEMNLMMAVKGANDFGGSLSGTAKVTNPAPAKIGKIPGVGAGARAARAKYYELVHKLVSSPATLRYIERGLMGRDPAELQRAREIIHASVQRGKAMGTGAGQGFYQGTDEQPTPENSRLSPESLGARQAPDGKFYLPDPQRPGKYLEVRP